MKIKEVKISHFKNISSADIVPARVNILAGSNGMGKTSFMESVRCAITGRAPEDFMEAGASKCSVMVDIDDLGTVERIYSREKTSKVRVCGKATTAKAAGETLANLFGCSALSMNMMFSSELIEKMMGTELAEYLLTEGFLRNDMTIDKLLALCSLSKEAESELRMMLPEAPELLTLDDIQEAYDDCFAIRKKKKQELSEAEALTKYIGVVPTRSVSEINAEQMQIAEKIGKLSADISAHKKLEQAYKAHMENLEFLQGKLKAYEKVKAPSKTEREVAEESLRKTAALAGEVDSSIRMGRMDIAAMEKILDALSQPVCPISEKLVCATDKTGVRSELESSLASKRKYLEEQTEKKQKLDTELATLTEKKESLDKQAMDYKAKLTYFEQLEKEKKNVLSKPESIEASEDELEEMKTRADVLLNEMDAATKYARAQEAERQCVTLKKAVEIQNELVTQLSPKDGVRQKILEFHAASLQEYCNSKMATVLPKYQMVLDTSNGFRVMFALDSGEMISYSSISKGEQIRVAYVLMSMFNALNQFRILMLDNLDGLDEESCQLLLNLIAQDIDDFDHVFMASCNDSLVKAAGTSTLSDVCNIVL